MSRRITLREAQREFETRTPFSCNGTLFGYRGRPITWGDLPGEWTQYLRQFGQYVEFSVVSYVTPIAWVMADGRVIVPPVHYSQTSGRHLRALGLRWSEPVVDQEVAA